jgi:hypothetical protein
MSKMLTLLKHSCRADGDELGVVKYSDPSFPRARLKRLFERVRWCIAIIDAGRASATQPHLQLKILHSKVLKALQEAF